MIRDSDKKKSLQNLDFSNLILVLSNLKEPYVSLIVLNRRFDYLKVRSDVFN